MMASDVWNQKDDRLGNLWLMEVDADFLGNVHMF